MSEGRRQAYNDLKRMIYGGQLEPGRKIVERDLARQLGVSRIPLRESIARLEGEGLVRCVPNSATYVEDFEPADLLEIYSMRLWLEPPAARLAVMRGDEKLAGKLRGLCDRMTECVRRGEFKKVDDLDYRFHHTIVLASNQRRLIRAYESSHIRIAAIQSRFLSQQAHCPQTTAGEHEQIIRSFETHEPDAAARSAYDHVCQPLIEFTRALGVPIEDLL